MENNLKEIKEIHLINGHFWVEFELLNEETKLFKIKNIITISSGD